MEPSEVNTLYFSARARAIKLLNRIERSDAYLDKLLDVELKSSELSNVDKSLMAELVHGVLRWQGKLDWILFRLTHGNFSKSEPNIKNTLRVALYQILHLNKIPHYAVVNEAVEFVKRIRGEKMANLVNAVLRNIIRNIDNLPYPKIDEDIALYYSVCYSHPLWLVKRWLQQYPPDEVEKLLIANNEVPTLTLRINKLKIEPIQFLSLLDQQNIAYQGSDYIDHFIKVKSLSSIAQLDIFQKGYFSIQDESAALPVLLLGVQPGDCVMDMCAAPGGKTTYIGEIMKNVGKIFAIDKYEKKLNIIKNSCERLGITNVQTIATDAIHVKECQVQKILIDAPCTGLGTLRKKPDIKWKREPDDINRLTEIQKKLLENAASIIEQGGVIVYSTCTIEPKENEQIIEWFINNHPEFIIEDASKFVNKSVVTQKGFVSTLPHRHHLDGSFAARLVKIK